MQGLRGLGQYSVAPGPTLGCVGRPAPRIHRRLLVRKPDESVRQFKRGCPRDQLVHAVTVPKGAATVAHVARWMRPAALRALRGPGAKPGSRSRIEPGPQRGRVFACGRRSGSSRGNAHALVASLGFGSISKFGKGSLRGAETVVGLRSDLLDVNPIYQDPALSKALPQNLIPVSVFVLITPETERILLTTS